MNLDALFRLFDEARSISGHQDFVVLGSLSVLGLEHGFTIPDAMTLSVDVDAYTKADPGRILDLNPALGENSPFHALHGYYLDPVSPDLPSFPEGWQDRLMKVERHGIRAWFLDPNDAALSKYARGEARDRRWIRAGIVSGVVSTAIVKKRFPVTNFLDGAEADAARRLVDDDHAWFETIEAQRRNPP